MTFFLVISYPCYNATLFKFIPFPCMYLTLLPRFSIHCFAGSDFVPERVKVEDIVIVNSLISVINISIKIFEIQFISTEILFYICV